MWRCTCARITSSFMPTVGKEVRAVLVSAHPNGWAVPREEGEALAIIDRGGHVVMVPMAPQHMMQARWLISKLMEWAERARARPGAWVRRWNEVSLAGLTEEGRDIRAPRARS
jgi:hypothetical protein